MMMLYPEIKTYAKHRLSVQPPHELYIEESGDPDGIPVLFVHGGPGSGCDPKNRCFFDPKHYRIILFDQRGAGRSTPHAELTNNHTHALVEDIEAIRNYLGIERWILFGGSWGSTLSLLYAQTYPERVFGLILRGIFLCRDQDIQWFYQSGANRFFPDYWKDFIAPINPEKRENIVSAYYDLLTDTDEVARMRAAEAWSVWEGRTSHLQTDPNTVDQFGDPYHALALARIESHYFQHKAFIEKDQILNNTMSIEQLPIHIIQGRYDMICPINQAFELYNKLPKAQFTICNHAGHSAMELEIAQALVRATDQFAAQLHTL